MSTARQSILKKLRNAVVSAPASVPDYQWPTIQDPLAHWKQLLMANHADILESTEIQLAQDIRQWLVQRGLTKVIASARILSRYPLLNAFAEPLPEGTLDNWKSTLFNEVEVGITSSLAAIIATGTVVIEPGIDEPRSLSLVPPCHIVIVSKKTFYNDFAQLMREQKWHTSMPTNRVLISGPSKTADIQQTLAYGAHGPSELLVVLTD